MLTGRGHYRLSRAGSILSEGDYANTISDEAKVAMIRAAFRGERPGANWYFGLYLGIEGHGTALGTMASHPNWREVTCGPVTRTPWGVRTFTTTEFTTDTQYRVGPVVITMTGIGEFKGIFSTNKEALGDDSGILWSQASLHNIGPFEVILGDILTLSYEMTLTQAGKSLTKLPD